MGQVRSAVLRQLQVAQRMHRGCGCCPEPSVLDLTAQHGPGLWVITWITPEKRLHGLWGPTKGILSGTECPLQARCCPGSCRRSGSALTASRSHRGKPQLSSPASGFPGSLVKMQMLIRWVWAGPAVSAFLTPSLRIQKLLVHVPHEARV